jgi:hypothetical protein
MIHIAHEGSAIKSGLNIGWSTRGSIWFRLAWRTDDLQSLLSTTRYFRLRLFIAGKWAPAIYWEKDSWNFLENWAAMNRVILLSRECYEDIPTQHRPPKYVFHKEEK